MSDEAAFQLRLAAHSIMQLRLPLPDSRAAIPTATPSASSGLASGSAVDGGVPDVVQQVVSGQISEYVVSHAGRSQYSRMGGGVSACGLAALNCARVIFAMERTGLTSAGLVRGIMKKETSEEVLTPCLSWSSPAHLDVDDIYQAPIFRRSMKLVSSDFGQSGLPHFKQSLRKLVEATRTSGSTACAIITRPPEIIACFSVANVKSNLFAIFDSHPRTKHPDGAAFIFMNSLDSAAEYLADLLKWDDRIVNDSSVQWQAQLLANFSAHIFVDKPKYGSPADLVTTALDASLQALKYRAESLELSSNNSTLLSQNEALRAEIQELQRKERLRSAASRKQTNVSGIWDFMGDQIWGAGPSNSNSASFPPLPRSSDPPPVREVRRPSNTTQPVRKPAWQSNRGKSKETPVDDFALASMMQMQANDEASKDAALAYEMQRQFDEERVLLDGELAALQSSQRAAFNCGVCFENYSEDAVALVQPCGHRFCRECLDGYAKSKVDERYYPIPCPSCMADTNSSEKSQGIVDDFLVQQLGLSEEQYAAFVEMQMASFSIILHCRMCKNSFFVDRSEYEETKIVTCPLHGCAYTWCKACSQGVEVGGPAHSCDGSSELRHLMTQRGWKYCPGCHTPAEKIDGCNHMTCRAPGCSTHFCYTCGEQIIRTHNRNSLRDAMQQHYAKCRLFEDVN